MNYKATRANLCTSIRYAIIALDCSPNRALNIINSEAGNMEIAKIGDDKTGDFKAKTFKAADKEDRVQVTVRPGSIQFKAVLTTALKFAAYNDINKAAEKLNPEHSVSIPANSEFGLWLKDKCPKASEAKTEEVTA